MGKSGVIPALCRNGNSVRLALCELAQDKSDDQLVVLTIQFAGSPSAAEGLDDTPSTALGGFLNTVVFDSELTPIDSTEHRVLPRPHLALPTPEQATFEQLLEDAYIRLRNTGESLRNREHELKASHDELFIVEDDEEIHIVRLAASLDSSAERELLLHWPTASTHSSEILAHVPNAEIMLTEPRTLVDQSQPSLLSTLFAEGQTMQETELGTQLWVLDKDCPGRIQVQTLTPELSTPGDELTTTTDVLLKDNDVDESPESHEDASLLFEPENTDERELEVRNTHELPAAAEQLGTMQFDLQLVRKETDELVIEDGRGNRWHFSAGHEQAAIDKLLTSGQYEVEQTDPYSYQQYTLHGTQEDLDLHGRIPIQLVSAMEIVEVVVIEVNDASGDSLEEDTINDTRSVDTDLPSSLLIPSEPKDETNWLSELIATFNQDAPLIADQLDMQLPQSKQRRTTSLILPGTPSEPVQALRHHSHSPKLPGKDSLQRELSAGGEEIDDSVTTDEAPEPDYRSQPTYSALTQPEPRNHVFETVELMSHKPHAFVDRVSTSYPSSAQQEKSSHGDERSDDSTQAMILPPRAKMIDDEKSVQDVADTETDPTQPLATKSTPLIEPPIESATNVTLIALTQSMDYKNGIIEAYNSTGPADEQPTANPESAMPLEHVWKLADNPDPDPGAFQLDLPSSSADTYHDAETDNSAHQTITTSLSTANQQTQQTGHTSSSKQSSTTQHGAAQTKHIPNSQRAVSTRQRQTATEVTDTAESASMINENSQRSTRSVQKKQTHHRVAQVISNASRSTVQQEQLGAQENSNNEVRTQTAARARRRTQIDRPGQFQQRQRHHQSQAVLRAAEPFGIRDTAKDVLERVRAALLRRGELTGRPTGTITYYSDGSPRPSRLRALELSAHELLSVAASAQVHDDHVTFSPPESLAAKTEFAQAVAHLNGSTHGSNEFVFSLN